MNKKYLVLLPVVVIVLLLACAVLMILGPILHTGQDQPVNEWADQSQFNRYQQNQISNWSAAQDRWIGQPLENYLLQIQIKTRIVSFVNGVNGPQSAACLMEIRVKNKMDATISRDTCGAAEYLAPPEFKRYFAGEGFNLFNETNSPLTLEGLFTSIQRAISQRWCGPNGCICDGYYAYSARYDPNLGIPKAMAIVYKRSVTGFGGFCTLAGQSILFPEYKFSAIPES